MKITVNGKLVEVTMDTTIADLIGMQNVDASAVVVEYNGIIIRQHDWNNTFIRSGDTLEIVTFVGGG
jgi:thiamine biosynthesis protein ThiS